MELSMWQPNNQIKNTNRSWCEKIKLSYILLVNFCKDLVDVSKYTSTEVSSNPYFEV